MIVYIYACGLNIKNHNHRLHSNYIYPLNPKIFTIQSASIRFKCVMGVYRVFLGKQHFTTKISCYHGQNVTSVYKKCSGVRYSNTVSLKFDAMLLFWMICKLGVINQALYLSSLFLM